MTYIEKLHSTHILATELYEGMPETAQRLWADYDNFRTTINTLLQKDLLKESRVFKNKLYIDRRYITFFSEIRSRGTIYLNIQIFNHKNHERKAMDSKRN